jgi:CheY-like chemotaxis protein
MDGHELAARLRAEPGPRAPVIVAVTGYGQPHDVEKSRSAGFAAHSVEPVDPDVLLAYLARDAESSG